VYKNCEVIIIGAGSCEVTVKVYVPETQPVLFATMLTV